MVRDLGHLWRSISLPVVAKVGMLEGNVAPQRLCTVSLARNAKEKSGNAQYEGM